jgi:hypothetical protein
LVVTPSIIDDSSNSFIFMQLAVSINSFIRVVFYRF